MILRWGWDFQIDIKVEIQNMFVYSRVSNSVSKQHEKKYFSHCWIAIVRQLVSWWMKRIVTFPQQLRYFAQKSHLSVWSMEHDQLLIFSNFNNNLAYSIMLFILELACTLDCSADHLNNKWHPQIKISGHKDITFLTRSEILIEWGRQTSPVFFCFSFHQYIRYFAFIQCT